MDTSAQPSFSDRLSVLRKLLPFLGIAICVAGVAMIIHLLREYSVRDVLGYLRSIPLHLSLSALGLTFFSYLVLTAYDLLAFRFLGRELPPWKVVFVAFIAFSFGNNIGMASLAGSSVRFRLYSAFGVPAGKILKIILFSSLTFWLGVAALGGILFSFFPLRLPEELQLPAQSMRLMGLVLLLSAGIYLTITTWMRRPFYVRGMRLQLPPSTIGIQQMSVAAFDWVLAAYVLYLLMPPSIEAGFGFFLTVFLSAQVLALIAHVPGGIGVLETMVLYFIAPHTGARPEILGALLAYRVIYYFIPLAVAVTGLLTFEIRRRRDVKLPGVRMRDLPLK